MTESQENLLIIETFQVKYKKDLYYFFRNRSSTEFLDSIGCTCKFLSDHLQKQFKDHMGWENYGLWQLDHRSGIRSFDIRIKKERDKANHWSNLQPLWREENTIKRTQDKKFYLPLFQLSKNENHRVEIDMNKIKASKIWSSKKLNSSYNPSKSNFWFF